MPSLLKTSSSSRHLLLYVANILFVHLYLSSSSSVQGASLREHRLIGSDSQVGNIPQTPNADMIKALEYIENLQHRTGAENQQRFPLPGGYDPSYSDDGEKLRAMLRLMSNPTQSDEEGEEEEEEEEGREDKSEELLQAVFSTLQQTEKQQKQRGITPHRKLPIMFEDEEEAADEDGENERPFKRTNENVEEKYTPQNLATLQSVFDELDKLTSTKPLHKRQDEDDEEDEEEDDMFNVRNVDFPDWGSLQDQEDEAEENEEGIDERQEAIRGLDYVDNDNEDMDEEEMEKDDNSYIVKRSKDLDDVTKIVDYYLQKVLEKREEEEEEKEERRRAAQAQYRENIDPQVIFRLIQISQKYQIPPQDLVDMLKTEENKDFKTHLRKNQLTRMENKLSQTTVKQAHKAPEDSFFRKHFPERQKSAEELRTEEILNILGLGGKEDPAPIRKQYQTAGRPVESIFAHRGTLKEDYDDTLDEDELAAYLAAQMLSQYPNPVYSKNNKQSHKRDEAEQSTGSSFEQALQDYFDQMDLEKSSNEKRQTEEDESESKTHMQSFDNEALKNLLSHLNPETEESEANTAKGYK